MTEQQPNPYVTADGPARAFSSDPPAKNVKLIKAEIREFESERTSFGPAMPKEGVNEALP
jgi:hypothetical protein